MSVDKERLSYNFRMFRHWRDVAAFALAVPFFGLVSYQADTFARKSEALAQELSDLGNLNSNNYKVDSEYARLMRPVVEKMIARCKKDPDECLRAGIYNGYASSYAAMAPDELDKAKTQIALSVLEKDRILKYNIVRDVSALPSTVAFLSLVLAGFRLFRGSFRKRQSTPIVAFTYV